MHSPQSLTAIAVKRALDLCEEASFLWASRSFAVHHSALTFGTLVRLDRRLSNLLSELSQSPVLSHWPQPDERGGFESGRAFVTAVLALRNGAATTFDALVTRLESQPHLLSPLASALAWLECDEVRECIEGLVVAPAPAAVRLGIAGLTAHRLVPVRTLAGALDSESPILRAAALEAVGRLGVQSLGPRLLVALEEDDAPCRFWAAWSAVRLGDRTGIPVLGRFAVDGGVLARPACDLALRALDPYDAVRAHTRLQSIEGQERLAVLSAGIIGDPVLADWLLQKMTAPSVARLAGAAFCLMTGADLRRDDLDSAGPPLPHGPEPFAVALPESDDADGRSSTDQTGSARGDEIDDDLPWPDAVRLREWWHRNRQALVPGNRYLAGMPIHQAELTMVLRTGNQHQRAAAALELALLDPRVPMLDVTAPAHRQSGGRENA